MKIAVVGGGSTYTPELLDGLIRRSAELGLTQVMLTDVDHERLEPVVAFCQRMAKAANVPLDIRGGALTDALVDARFVVAQIRVGGQKGRHEDIRLGLRHGLIGQETTGVGGFAKALRTIPAMLEIAKKVEQICPDAWLINFTNPAGLVTEALVKSGFERTLGLCNVPIELHMEMAKVLGRDKDDIKLDWVGLNHLGWVRSAHVDDEDVLPQLLESIEAGSDLTEEISGPVNLPEIEYPKGFLTALGMLPSSYVRFFYAEDAMLEEIRSADQTRAEAVMAIEAKLFAYYRDETSDSLPDLLKERGGAWYSRLAVDVIASLLDDKGSVQIVNTVHAGRFSGFGEQAVVEVPCRIDKNGAEVLPGRDLDPSIVGLVRAVKAYEELAIDAAVHRDRNKAFLALVNHPLVPNAGIARRVLDDLITRDLI